MKYCSVCGAEYQSTATSCRDCEGSELLSLEDAKARGVKLAHDVDTAKFVRADTAEDPLTADRFTQILEGNGIKVFARPRRSSAVDMLSGTGQPYWEMLVPEESLEKAAALLRDERARLLAGADDAARAAEEEEAETEKGIA